MPTAHILTLPTSPSSWADEIDVSLPPPDDILLCWPQIEPILKRATDRDRAYEPIDILLLVMQGRLSMFVIRDGGPIAAVVVTEIRQYPRCRVLEVRFIAGTGLRRLFRPILDALDAQAESLDCISIAGFERKGWSRFGFEIIGVSLVRRLKD
jgi:hypothetical protein